MTPCDRDGPVTRLTRRLLNAYMRWQYARMSARRRLGRGHRKRLL